MLDQQKRRTIVDSFKLVVPIADTAADLFYRRLFELQPSYRALFSDDLARQKAKLVSMLAFIVKSLDFRDEQWREDVNENEDLFYVLLALGRRHTELYRIPDESYEVVGEALLWTLDYGLGEAFSDEVRNAWAEVYGAIAMTMKMGVSSKVELGQGRVA